MLGHVGLAGIREAEVRPTALAERCDEILVHQLLERRIHGTRAGPPCPRGFLGDDLDQAVTVRRRLGQE
jgi:hypothetical protein